MYVKAVEGQMDIDCVYNFIENLDYDTTPQQVLSPSTQQGKNGSFTLIYADENSRDAAMSKLKVKAKGE